MRTALRILVALAIICAFLPPVSAQQNDAAKPVASEQPLLIHGFNFIGNSVFSTAKLAQITQPSVEKSLTLTQLRGLADQIELSYHHRGYFLAKVLIPEQTVEGGVISFRVFEGKLGKVSIVGNKRYKEAFLQQRFAQLKKEGVIREAVLERELLNLNNLPGLSAKSVLQPGAEVGTTDVVVTVAEKQQVSATVDANDFGPEGAQIRYTTGAALANPFSIGDALSLTTVEGEKSSTNNYQNVAYSLPIGVKGGRIGAYYLNGNVGAGRQFAALDITGKSTAEGISYTHVLALSRKRTDTLDIGLDFRNSKQDMLGFTSSDDHVRVLHINLEQGVQTLRSSTFFVLGVEQGLGSALGGMKNFDELSSRPYAGADDSFTKLTLYTSHSQYLSPITSIVGRLSGQIASRSLVTGEQFALGGPDSVRGYRPSEAIGDDGLQASLEARFAANPKAPEKFQSLLFVDWGNTNIKSPALGQTKHENLAGAGFGFRYNPSTHISMRLDVGFPIGHKPSTGSSALPCFEISGSY